MRNRWARRIVGVGLLALVAGATLLAQRGFTGRRQPFRPLGPMTKAPYDGRFTFVRMSYDEGLRGGFGRGGPHWSHDYPAGETHFLQILTAVSSLSANLDATSIMAFDDPDMFRNPVIYLVEPGYWLPTDAQVAAIRTYLAKGGFLIVDDFPDWAWTNFEDQMRRVWPEGRWFDLNGEPEHPIFHTFYEVDANALATAYDLGGRPVFRALYRDNDPEERMQVIANYQNDLSEYWEFSDTGLVAVDETNEAYKFGVNEFIYGITH